MELHKGIKMTKKNILSIFLSLVVLSSCAPARFYIDTYLNHDPANTVLVVTKVNEIDLSQDYELFNEENLRKLRTSFHELHLNRLPLNLQKESNFKNVTMISYKESPQFEPKKYVINPDETIELMVPKSKLNYDLEGIIYTLFLQDYKIAFELEEVDSSDPAKHFSAEKLPGLDPQLSPRKLYRLNFTIRTKYFIYDNSSSKVVLAGNAVIKERYSPEMDLENKMLESLNSLAKRIINKTPFEK